MNIEVTFLHVERSEAVEAEIHKKAQQLTKYFSRILAVRATVSVPHRHSKNQEVYEVKVDLIVPHKELLASKSSQNGNAHSDILTAVHDAFRVAKRRLVEYKDVLHGEVKRHEAAASIGKISKVFHDRDFGFIVTPDSRQIYFHKNAVTNKGFDTLKPGTEVRYHEELGVNGPQSTYVSPS